MDLTDVDVDWARERLKVFVAETEAVSADVMNRSKRPACGRDRAIELMEAVLPILNRLYPEWRLENSLNQFDEFRQERDASKRLLVRLDDADDVAAKLGGRDGSPRISAASLHRLIWQAAQAQWSTGHRHEAVLAAAKAVNSQLQSKVGRRDVSEGDLVRQVFSKDPPATGRPRLRFLAVADKQARESMRQGAMDFGAGCFAAIRNPLGHLPNDEVDLDEQTALERLAALSLLARWIDDAILVHEADTISPA